MPSTVAGKMSLTLSFWMRICRDWQVWKPWLRLKKLRLTCRLSWWRRAKRRASWTKPLATRLPTTWLNRSIRTSFCCQSRRMCIRMSSFPRQRPRVINRSLEELACKSMIPWQRRTGKRFIRSWSIGNWNWKAARRRWWTCCWCRRKRRTWHLASLSRRITRTGSIILNIVLWWALIYSKSACSLSWMKGRKSFSSWLIISEWINGGWLKTCCRNFILSMKICITAYCQQRPNMPAIRYSPDWCLCK